MRWLCLIVIPDSAFMPLPGQEGKLRPKGKHVPCEASARRGTSGNGRVGDALETDTIHLGAEGEHVHPFVLLLLGERAKKP